MNSEKKTVIKCWSCEKKFTISASAANPSITIYKGLEPSVGESQARKKRLLKTCPYCNKENEIEL